MALEITESRLGASDAFLKYLCFLIMIVISTLFFGEAVADEGRRLVSNDVRIYGDILGDPNNTQRDYIIEYEYLKPEELRAQESFQERSPLPLENQQR